MNKIILYDFDGTLTPYPITQFKILEVCGYVGGGNNTEFQKLVKEYMNKYNKTVYESFYTLFLETLKSNDICLTNENVSKGAEDLEYNKGVEEFLVALCKSGIKNYIISSSIEPFLNNISISKYFEGIYATSFQYNNENIIGIKDLMTDIKKVEIIKSIVGNKSYNNVIYIGDGLTDIESMEYIKNKGGIAIYLYEDNVDEKIKGAVNYFYKKDFRLDGDLYNKIKEVLKI